MASARKKAGKRPTVHSLAKLANVSPGTVSRVLNNRDRVHPDTRARILMLAKEVGLKPQATVRNREIAIVTDPGAGDRHVGYCGIMTAALSYALSELGVSVVLPTDPVQQLPDIFLDGVIAVTFNKPIREMLAEQESRLNVIYLDWFYDRPVAYSVNSDHYQSGYLAAQHFIERGRRKLGFLGLDLPPFLERLRGFRKAMEEAGLPVNEKLLYTEADGSAYNGLTRIVKNGADAVFVPGTSLQSVEGLHLLSYVMEKRIPEDIAVIGSEIGNISPFLVPPLTTATEPLEEMAREAAGMMMDLMEGRELTEPKRVLPVRIIERESC